MPTSRCFIRQTSLIFSFLLAAQASWASESASPPSLKLEGGADVYYGFDLNRPAGGASFPAGTGTTAKRADELSLNLASVGVGMEPAPVGFRLLLGYGTAMDVVHGGESRGDGVGPEVWRAVQQAAVQFARGPLSVEAGISPSHIGYETFQSQANWNYTRSWMGEFSPYYQAGVKVAYRFSDAWSAQVHLLNGWQVSGDNNHAKAVGTQLAWSTERVSITWNTFAGPELPGDDLHWRLFSDVVATVKATSALDFAATFDAGLQQRPFAEAARWYAGAAYARYQVAAPVAVAVRAEVFHDPEGVISGTGQTLLEGTATVEVKPVEHLVLKLEARHDRSTAPVFAGHVAPGGDAPALTNAQTLLVASAVAYF